MSEKIGMPSPEEMAKIQGQRALSDAELIKGGAEYVVDENGMRLDVTNKQIKEAEKEMQIEEMLEIVDSKDRKKISELINSPRIERKMSPLVDENTAGAEISFSDEKFFDTYKRNFVPEEVIYISPGRERKGKGEDAVERQIINIRLINRNPKTHYMKEWNELSDQTKKKIIERFLNP